MDMAHDAPTNAAPTAQKFPTSFWTANLTELFERAAYYSMASFLVIYLGRLGLGAYWPSTLSSSVLWFLVYFLPILSGTIADQIGFRRALLIAFVLIAAGYFLMGYPVWFGGATLAVSVG
jgi:proton-dependent oligopeptide transporter, POT family